MEGFKYNVLPVYVVYTSGCSSTAAVVHLPAPCFTEEGAVRCPHQHRGARGPGQEGDCAVVTVLLQRILASQGTQPGVAVEAVT